MRGSLERQSGEHTFRQYTAEPTRWEAAPQRRGTSGNFPGCSRETLSFGTMSGGVSWRLHSSVASLGNLAVFMLQSRAASRILAVIGLILGPAPADADSGASANPGVALAVVDFAYVDTSGEPTDQAALHRERLQAFMTALRQDLAADGTVSPRASSHAGRRPARSMGRRTPISFAPPRRPARRSW